MIYRHPDNQRFGMTTLSSYPANVLTIKCSLCPRRHGTPGRPAGRTGREP